MSLLLLATVDIMTLSLCCFAIIMLIEGEDGPRGLLQPLLDVRLAVPSLRSKFLRLVLRTLDLLLKLQVPSARSRVTWMMI